MTSEREFMQKALGIEKASNSNNGELVARAPVGVPKIAPFSDWDYYYLLSPISWTSEGDSIGKFESVEAPRGFVTDLASVPKFLWPILPPTSRYTHAAIIHDFHYWTQTVSRSEADEIFSIGMGELNVPEWSSFAIHKAVKLAGGKAWDNNAKLKANGESRFLKKLPKEPSITWSDWKSRKGVFH